MTDQALFMLLFVLGTPVVYGVLRLLDGGRPVVFGRRLSMVLLVLALAAAGALVVHELTTEHVRPAPYRFVSSR